MKYLFIDDNGDMLGALRRTFSGNSDVGFAHCQSVEEALASVAKYEPQIVFLDHHLSEGGNEGIMIVDRLKGVKIYSTTSDMSVRKEYEKRGIQNVGKTDMATIRVIVNS